MTYSVTHSATSAPRRPRAASVGAAFDADLTDARPTLPGRAEPTGSVVKSEVDDNPFREMGGSNEADFNNVIMLAPSEYFSSRGRAREVQGGVKMPKRSDAASVKRGRGQPPHEPTQVDRDTITAMVAGGIAQVDIARCRGISLPTLRKHYRGELDSGMAAAH